MQSSPQFAPEAAVHEEQDSRESDDSSGDADDAGPAHAQDISQQENDGYEAQQDIHAEIDQLLRKRAAQENLGQDDHGGQGDEEKNGHGEIERPAPPAGDEIPKQHDTCPKHGLIEHIFHDVSPLTYGHHQHHPEATDAGQHEEGPPAEMAGHQNINHRSQHADYYGGKDQRAKKQVVLMIDSGHEGEYLAVVLVQRCHRTLAERTDVSLAHDLDLAFITVAHSLTSLIQRIGYNRHGYPHGRQRAEKAHLNIRPDKGGGKADDHIVAVGAHADL